MQFVMSHNNLMNEALILFLQMSIQGLELSNLFSKVTELTCIPVMVPGICALFSLRRDSKRTSNVLRHCRQCPGLFNTFPFIQKIPKQGDITLQDKFWTHSETRINMQGIYFSRCAFWEEGRDKRLVYRRESLQVALSFMTAQAKATDRQRTPQANQVLSSPIRLSSTMMASDLAGSFFILTLSGNIPTYLSKHCRYIR